jgi:adenine-specific DNA-methyltransferase
MYPRLKLARNLLKDDGVIFISIDDNEVANLRLLCDEIFGEKNFIRNVIWEKKYSPANDSKVISDTHDHILVYAKNISEWTMKLLPRTEEMNKRYSNPDNDSRGAWKPGGLSAKTYSSKYDYPVVTPSGKTVYPPTGSCWQVSQEKLEMLISDNKIYFGKKGDAKPQIKQFLTDVRDGVVSRSIWKYDEVGHNQTSRKELTDLFDGEFLFDNPKPTTLIERIFDITTFAENDIVLDFFSGSGSTAHAVFKYNLKHNLNLHFILIQIPDRVTVNSVAEQKGYKNICEIGKERIRRAGDKIIADSPNKDLSGLDIGFKVFKIL